MKDTTINGMVSKLYCVFLVMNLHTKICETLTKPLDIQSDLFTWSNVISSWNQILTFSQPEVKSNQETHRDHIKFDGKDC